MAAMEDVLDLYAEPYDPDRPVVCFDETSTQLLADTNSGAAGTTAASGLRVSPRRYAQHLPDLRTPGGLAHVAITERRTMEDFANQMRWLVDVA